MREKPEENRLYKEDDIAIIGMAGRFPEADDLEEFWDNLKNGKDSIRDLPASRIEELKNILGDIPEVNYARSGYLDRISYFEPEIFSISREESKFIDPQQRLLLELVEEAILDAGYNPVNLDGKNIGVFVSQNENQYTKNFSALSPMAFQNSNHSVGAGRVAYTYNFTGPAITIGTACSSGLVALNNAKHSLKFGESELAVVGGVKLGLLPGDESSIGSTPILSMTQKVKTFDKDADGTVGGEGGGALLLKPLHKALKDGDNIHAIIKGSAINSDGNRSNGMSSPSEEGQEEVILQAIENAEIDPLSISYIETHGTGTKIGDPIEVAGISQALDKLGYPKHSVALSAVKTNIGHLDGAAGLAGVIKTVLALKNKKLLPSINFKAPNPLIDFLNSPVYVNDNFADWHTSTIRRAGVTSLGITGTNSHIILEESPVVENSTPDYKNIVALSARTEKSLELMIKRLSTYLSDHKDLAINDIAFTLNLGRRDLKYKFVTIADSTENLINKLNSFESENPKDEETEYLYYRLRNKDKKAISTALMIPDIEDIMMEDLEELLSSDLEFKKYTEQFIQHIDDDGDLNDPKIKYALLVYAWIKLLGEYSIKPKIILGFGIGSIVANLASAQISFEDAIKQLKAYTLKKIEITEEKLNSFLDTIIQRGVNTCILFSPEQTLGNLFKKVLDNKEKITLMIQNQNESSLAVITKLMQNGMTVKWNKVYENHQVKRVSLPGYVFDTQGYFMPIESKGMGLVSQTSETNLLFEETDPDLLHNLIWTEEELKRDQINALDGIWIIFNDQLGLSKLLVDQLKSEDVKIIQVSSGEEFQKIDDLNYQINIVELNNYEQLIQDIYKTDQMIDGIINLSTCHKPMYHFNLNHRDAVENSLNEGYYSILYLTQALLKKYKDLNLYHITTNAHRVLEDDSLICPEKRMIWILNKVINQEVDHYNSYCIDLDFNSSTLDEVCQQIIDEIRYDSDQLFEIAYRKDKRFIQYLSPVETNLENNLVIKDGGVYLITGGTGGIGLEISKYLASAKKVNLILLNRTPLSEKSRADQEYKLGIIKDLQTNGTTVETMYGDVSDYQQMKEIVSKVKASYGKIDGVVHTAGLPGERPLISFITKNDAENVFAAKVYGTLVLADLLRDQFLDFFITCSSLSSQVGGFGFGIYASANSFLDSFCALQRQLGKKYIAINWGSWGEVGMGAGIKDHSYSSGLSNLTNAEGISVFATILNNNLDNYSVNKLTDKVAKLFASFAFFKIKGKNNLSKAESTYIIDDQSIEESLYSMLRDVYVGDELELTDKILDLELDSIDVMQFVGKLKKAVNVTIPMKLFFDNLTVSEMFERIRTLILGESDEQNLIIKQPDQEFYPVSTSQNRLYLVTQLDKESIAYNLNTFWFIGGNVDQIRIEYAVKELIKRHESLRTSFELSDGKIIQKVNQEVDFTVNYFEAKEAEIENLNKNFVRPFDLSKAPLFRVNLLKVDDKYLLMMDLHHIIFDGVSQNILFREFLALYKGEKLLELKLQYRDFATWQYELLNSDKIKPQKEYWLETFSGEIPKLSMPTDHPRPKILDFKGNSIRFTVDPELTGKLNELIKAQGITMFMLILAAYNVLLGKYANQEDVIVGVTMTGRHHSDLENIIGMFVNTMPLRNYPIKAKTFSEFLADLKENTLKAYENQDYPLEMLVDNLKLVHDPGRNPLFDVVFNLNNQRREGEFADIELDGLTLKMYEHEQSTAIFDLSLDGVELGGKIEFEIEYRTSLFKKETIDQFAKDLLKILEIVVDEPEIKIHDIKLVEELEILETGQFTEVGFDF
ncbi:MAG: SDR family NAD(P)-dependent oxidoreductase [Halanaerobiales bacterium]|nr:SDR family NAD(P)-dependent oxidoreductase [Halanaerobiales bacterium]